MYHLKIGPSIHRGYYCFSFVCSIGLFVPANKNYNPILDGPYGYILSMVLITGREVLCLVSSRYKDNFPVKTLMCFSIEETQ